IRLMAHRKPTAGGSGFEVRIADLAWHGNPHRVQYGSNIHGAGPPWTMADAISINAGFIGVFRGRWWTPEGRFSALSRRKHGFESRRARQGSKNPRQIR